MRFETDKDLNREELAIQSFVGTFKGTYQKLGENDVDFKISDANGIAIAFAEVKGRMREVKDAYPLPVSVKKLIKITDKNLVPVIIWACYDGIIYSKVNELKGTIKIGGRKPRVGSHNDIELMAYYSKENNNFKTIYY